MIKLDPFMIRDTEKRIMLVAGVLSVFITIYTIPVVLFAKWQITRENNRLRIVLGYLVSIIVCWIWNAFLNPTETEILRSYWHYLDNVFIIHPFRLIVSFSYGILFVFLGHRMNEGMDDWVIEQEKNTREKLLPIGQFDFGDRSHTLMFGATRSGKGIVINYIMKNRLLFGKDELMVVVSAKLARGDKYSQLGYLRNLCEKTGRTLYVVSMDESVTDRCQYNPFKYLKEEEMINALKAMLEFDSHYYSGNFTEWVMAIYDLIKLGDEKPVSIENILKLYNWETYCRYAVQLHNNGKITDEQLEEVTNDMIRTYADVAKNDSANLSIVARNCKSVFRKTPNQVQITITDAFAENAIIYFDLNGISSAESVKMLGGACIMAELQHCMVDFGDEMQKKTIILDEASYYMNEHLVKAFFNLSASMGYQYIVSTQGPSDLSSESGTLLHQLCNNLGQLACLKLGDAEDVEVVDSIIGTTITSENTHRAQSVDYDQTGSIKAKDQMYVPHDVIKTLEPLNMIYYQKKRNKMGEAHPVKVIWDTDDL